MAYQSWSVVFGEQPSAAKWNILGTNDASFNDGTGIADSAITTAKIATDAITATKIDWASTGADAGIWWEEIGRTTLAGAGDTITVSSLPARKHLRILITALDSGGTLSMALTFNGDTGANYAVRESTNGAADATAGAGSSVQLATTTAGYPMYSIVEINDNNSGREKIFSGHTFTRTTTGAANIPGRREVIGKWANTSSAISSVTLTNGGTGDYAIGSEVVVLGHN